MRKFNPLRHEDKLANTLIEYVELKYDVRVYCRRCTHNRILWLNALIAWKGAKYRLNRRKMRCSMCYGLGGEFVISDQCAGKKSYDRHSNNVCLAFEGGLMAQLQELLL